MSAVERWLGDYSEPWGKLELETDRRHWGIGMSVRYGKLGTRYDDPRPRSFWTCAVRLGPSKENDMTTDTTQARNRKAATIEVEICEICFVSHPADQAETHAQWHVGRDKTS